MRYLILGTLVIVIFTFAAREVAAQPRTCVRADIAETFVLPDGSRHPAGRLRICLDQEFSPVAGLHTIVADQAAARFTSRRTKVEGADHEGSRIAFVRDGSGALALRGYTLARGSRVEAYWIQPARTRVVASAPPPPADTVWLAAAVIP